MKVMRRERRIKQQPEPESEKNSALDRDEDF